MTDLTQAARQALEALKDAADALAGMLENPATAMHNALIAEAALRAALEAPTPAVTGHIYQGNCPDELNSDARDSECPACQALEAQQESQPAAWQERVEVAPGKFSDWYDKRTPWALTRPREIDSGGILYQFRPLYTAANPSELLAELDGERNRSQMYADIVRAIAVVLHGEGWSDTSKLAQEVEALKADAERYRWLASHCKSYDEPYKGGWSIHIQGAVPARHDCEDAIDAAIDVAKGGE